MQALSTHQLQLLTDDIKRWGVELGFQQIGISNVAILEDEQHLLKWNAVMVREHVNWVLARQSTLHPVNPAAPRLERDPYATTWNSAPHSVQLYGAGESATASPVVAST